MRSNDPAIPRSALAQHHVARPASFDVVGYTMMSCADLHAAFERLIRYMLILSDALTMTMSEERGGYRMAFVLFGGDRPIPRQRIEFIFVNRHRASAAGSAGAKSIRGRSNLPIPRPRSRALYRDAFPLSGVVRRAAPQYSVCAAPT